MEDSNWIICNDFSVLIMSKNLYICKESMCPPNIEEGIPGHFKWLQWCHMHQLIGKSVVVQECAQVNLTESIKSRLPDPLWKAPTGDNWISLTKGP